jgi:virulence factor
MAQIEFQSGSLGSVLYFNHAGASSERLELYGGGVSASVDLQFQTLRTQQSNGATYYGMQRWLEVAPSRWSAASLLRGFEYADRHFIECVKNRAVPLTNAEDAYRSHELMDAIYRQAGHRGLE